MPLIAFILDEREGVADAVRSGNHYRLEPHGQYRSIFTGRSAACQSPHAMMLRITPWLQRRIFALDTIKTRLQVCEASTK